MVESPRYLDYAVERRGGTDVGRLSESMTDQNKPMPKVPPRPVRNVGSSGNWPSNIGPASGTGPASPPLGGTQLAPSLLASEQQTQIATAPSSAPGGHGLKVVTIS